MNEIEEFVNFDKHHPKCMKGIKLCCLYTKSK